MIILSGGGEKAFYVDFVTFGKGMKIRGVGGLELISFESSSVRTAREDDRGSSAFVK